MHTRHLRCLVGLAAALAGEFGYLAAAHAATDPAVPAARSVHTVHVVHSGESIQAAVDAAAPGDTVDVLPGTYRESVQIRTDHLTLRGAGQKTVLEPAKGQASNACAKAGDGICVTGTAKHPVTGVRIRALTVTGFAKDGVWGSNTDQMDVRHVVSENNGEQGLGQEKSTRGVFSENTSRNNIESGVFLANLVDGEGGAIDTRGASVRRNDLSGNRIGVVIRRARNLVIQENAVSGNCGGVFVVGDESTPRAGDLTIRRNSVRANNRYCAPNGRLPAIQGAGVVLTGSDGSQVVDNQVEGNAGSYPMSGGIVLYPSEVGAPNTRNTVRGNTALGNQPADLVDRDTAGTGNTFVDNTCRVSQPAGLC